VRPPPKNAEFVPPTVIVELPPEKLIFVVVVNVQLPDDPPKLRAEAPRVKLRVFVFELLKALAVIV
jgi:hypothetical protein